MPNPLTSLPITLVPFSNLLFHCLSQQRMEDPLHFGSIFNSQESTEELRQKLLNTTLELETLRSVNTELLNLLNMAYQDRDEVRNQLQKLKALVMIPSTNSNELKNPCVEVLPESLVTLPTAKANSSITESNSLSHVSSPIDAVSSPEFSNMNVVDSSHKNLGYPYLSHHHHHLVHHEFNGSSPTSFALVSCEKPASDPASSVIDCLAKGKVLPQQGKLLQAVMDAGPLLQTLLLAGPLPTWRNPPPLQDIKVPPLAVKGFDTLAGIDFGYSFASTWNSSSPSVLNFGGGHPLQLTSNAGVKNYAPSSNRQRGQIFFT